MNHSFYSFILIGLTITGCSKKVPEPNDHVRNEIELLKSSDLLPIIKESLAKITKELPGPNIKIIILPASSLNRPTLEKIKLPISGITPGSGKFILSIDPTFKTGQISYSIV